MLKRFTHAGISFKQIALCFEQGTALSIRIFLGNSPRAKLLCIHNAGVMLFDTKIWLIPDKAGRRNHRRCR